MKFSILTLFPRSLRPYVNSSVLKRAQKKGLIKIEIIDIRKFAKDRHRPADDRPYGGGPGMVLKAEPILKALQHPGGVRGKQFMIITSPGGKKFTARMAKALAGKKHIVIIAGHYEGIDERVKKILGAKEISIGD